MIVKPYKIGIKKENKWSYTNMITTSEVLLTIISEYLSDDKVKYISISKEGDQE